MMRLAINGFGRIGRNALRIILDNHPEIEVVAINTSGSLDIAGWAHLFQYDSVHGQFSQKVNFSEEKKDFQIGILEIGATKIPVLAQRDPALIPWKDFQVDVVLECTGHFTDKKTAGAHLKAGAKKVIISAEAKELDDYVLGVNDDHYEGETIIGNASCTTNCIAPLVKIIHDSFGIQKAVMSTIHAYTSTQQLTDDSNDDLRRARAAAINIIPTTTGAAKATVEVIPSLKGIFDGVSYRVPVVCGSIAEIVFVTTKRTTVEDVNQVLKDACENEFKNLVEFSDLPLVSTDILGNSHSAIIDSHLTQVIDGDLVKVVAWYDNEWGYSCRLVELAIKINNYEH